MITNRIKRVQDEIVKLGVEKEVLEWIESFFPVEHTFTAVTYPTYFSMRVKTLIDCWETPTAEDENDSFKRYKYPKVSVEVAPWQIYSKLITIFEPHEYLYYGVDRHIAGVYTKDEFRYMNSSQFSEKHPTSKHQWTQILPFYIDAGIKNDITGSETLSPHVDLYDAKLIFYVKTPFTVKAFDGLERHVPLRIEIETLPKNLGLKGFRHVVRRVYNPVKEKLIYGKGHILIEDEDETRVWTTKNMSGGFHRFVIEA